MEQDKKLQEILLQGAEKASIHFTEGIMQRIQDLSAAPSPYQPLVNRMLVKIFIGAFAVTVASILLLCLAIGSADLALAGWTAMKPLLLLIQENSRDIVLFILLFWAVFIVHAVVKKRADKLHWA